MCVNSLEGFKLISRKNCSEKCFPDLKKNCRISDSVEVFTSKGPYILNISVNTPDNIFINENIILEASVTLAGLLIDYGNSNWNLSLLYISWNVDGISLVTNTTVKTNAYSVFSHQFLHVGTFNLEVTASNYISTVIYKKEIVVTYPIPKKIGFSLLRSKSELPSCIPFSYNQGKNLIVLTNRTATFQATVIAGSNIIFQWKFDNNTIIEEVQLYQGITFRISLQEWIFHSVGNHNISIKVVNEYGSTEEIFHVVVLDFILSEVDVKWKPQYSHFSAINSIVEFTTSLKTNSLHNLSVKINFGDGILKTLSLTNLLNGVYQNEFHNFLSYDSDCKLSLKFGHIFTKENIFNVSFHIFNGNILKNIILSGIKIVQELSELIIYSPNSFATHKSLNITISLKSDSIFRNTTWTLLNKDGVILESVLLNKNYFNWIFNLSGLYIITVHCENELNFVNSEHALNVQNEIEEFVLTTSDRFPVKTGQTVSFFAKIRKGTDVTFSWNFSGPCTICKAVISHFSFNSSAVIIFLHNGDYNLILKAANLVSQQNITLLFSVETMIQDFNVLYPKSVLLGNLITLINIIYQDSQSIIEINFKNGIIKNCTIQKFFCEVDYIFHTSGIHSILVQARNNVSSLTKEIEIHVEENLGGVAIIFYSPVIVKHNCILLVTIHGKISQKSDLIYTWNADGLVRKISTIPIMYYYFQKEGYINISVDVSNQVSSISSYISINIISRLNVIHLSHKIVVAVDELVNFVLQGLDESDIVIVYCLLKKINEQFKTNITTKEKRWQHTFKNHGIFEITAFVIVSSNLTKILHSVISVQRPIDNLFIEGPRLISKNELFKEKTWTALVTGGTNLVYQWTVNNITLTKTYSKFTYALTEPDTNFIQVIVSNELGSSKAFVYVKVMHPLYSLHMDVPVCVCGQNSSIILTVEGESGFNLTVDYGDKSEIEVFEIISPPEFKASNVSKFHWKINHLFLKPGHYEVIVNASNPVTSLTRSKRALVEKAISGVKLKALSPMIVATLSEIEVVAEVEHGTNLEFTWNFGDRIEEHFTSIQNLGNSSIAKHLYHLPGEYIVTVTVTNHLKDSPIEVSLPSPFHVIEIISGLSLQLQEVFNFAIPLFFVNNILQTKELTFVSKVNAGSNVKFYFDYGDGSTESVEAELDFFTHQIQGFGKHIYFKAGVYNVTLFANNTLSQASTILTHLLSVQSPPRELNFRKQMHVTLFGNMTELEVHLKSGTDVKFDWSFGDETVLHNIGPSVSHMYLAAENFTVTVQAYNKVGKVFAYTVVSVQKQIQDVEIQIKSLLHLTKSEVKFYAIIPEESTVKYFVWNISDGKSITTVGPYLVHRFDRPGKYSVRVSAKNHVGTVTSQAVQLHLVEPIELLSLKHPKSALNKHSITFQAFYWFGSELSFTWDFGDGSNILLINQSKVNFTYQRTGEFIIKLAVSNLLSYANVSSHIFILNNTLCMPPEIHILGESQMMIPKSQEIYIEADVSFDCPATPKADYRWTLIHSLNSSIINISTINQYLFQQRVLLLPSRSLDYGVYIAELKVKMHGTIVYSKTQIEFSIIPSSLQPVIAGGKINGFHDKITLNASLSYDPDFDDSSTLRYEWKCEILYNHLPCFKDVIINPLLSDNAVISFPASLLTSAPNFHITLTISKPNRNKTAVSQLLNRLDSHFVKLSIERLFGDETSINTNSRLAFHAVCPECYKLENLEFNWILRLSLDGAQNFPLVNFGDCVEGNGSSYHYLMAPNDTFDLGIAEDSKNLSISKTIYSSPTSGSIFNILDNGRKVLFNVEKDDHLEVISVTKPTLLEQQNVLLPSSGLSEGMTGSRRDLGFHRLNIFNIDEGVPGEGGSTGARDLNNFPIKNSESNRFSENSNAGRRPSYENSGILNNDRMKNTGDQVKDENIASPVQSLHVISKPNVAIYLSDVNTTTGFNGKYFILKAGILKEKRTYLLEVSIKSKNGVIGSDKTFFTVNEGPVFGKCFVNPDSGIEMETEFKILCYEWKDIHKPLMYELSYYMTDQYESHIIYYGMNHDVRIKLPAGNPKDNFTLLFNIAIWDNLKARTSICSIPLKVTPMTFNKKKNSVEQFLLENVIGPNNNLSILHSQGNNPQTLQFIRLIANKLHQIDLSENSCQLCSQAREILLGTILQIPIRNQHETIQVISALFTVVVPKQLSEVSLYNIVTIVQRITTKEVNYCCTSEFPCVKALQLLTKIFSSFTEVITFTHSLKSSTAKQLMMNFQSYYSNLFQAQLQCMVNTEKALQLKGKFVSAIGGRYSVDQVLMTEIENAKFTIANLNFIAFGTETDLFSDTNDFLIDCIIHIMISYQQNPFSLSNQIQSKVLAHHLFSCNGKEIFLNSIPNRKPITMTIPQNLLNLETGSNYILHKHQMNIHKFNISQDLLHQKIFISLELERKQEGRLFPLSLYIGPEILPQPASQRGEQSFRCVGAACNLQNSGVPGVL